MSKNVLLFILAACLAMHALLLINHARCIQMLSQSIIRTQERLDRIDPPEPPWGGCMSLSVQRWNEIVNAINAKAREMEVERDQAPDR